MILKNLRDSTIIKSLSKINLSGLGIGFRYFMFWICYFLLFRAIFLCYHYAESKQLEIDTLFGVFVHGLKMDVSFSSYLCLLLLVVLAFSVFLSQKLTIMLVNGLTICFIILLSSISIIDLELFKEWGFRMDASPLAYLSTPREMGASVAASPYVLLVFLIIISVLISYRIYKKFLISTLEKLPPVKLIDSLLYLLLAAALIIPIRGGLQLAPMNQSIVFFSKNDFANQAAINASWNFFWSFSKQLHTSVNPYEVMPEDQAEDLVKTYYASSGKSNDQILNTENPNVIIILWESFTSKVLQKLGGGSEHVVPEFENLIDQGILFENFYANGDRSDKGLVALLSGFPAQPTRSIVKIPAKSSKLPTITEIFNQNQYYTGYFHGGELEFANIKSYLLSSEFNTILGKDSFKRDQLNSKWGAHDHVLLEKALAEINNQPLPFFNLIFTLSSHEPFEIPEKPKFPGEDIENLYKSSLYYTDKAVGNFIQHAKRQPWYENTLIIILADHGHRLLDEAPRYDKSRYHVPMLWLGGALAVKDSVITKTCSQTDIPKTLMSLLSMESESFLYSKNIFDADSKSGAFYTFNEGISFVSGKDELVFDHISKNLLRRTAGIKEQQVTLAKAHLQATYQDYLNK